MLPEPVQPEPLERAQLAQLEPVQLRLAPLPALAQRDRQVLPLEQVRRERKPALPEQAR